MAKSPASLVSKDFLKGYEEHKADNGRGWFAAGSDVTSTKHVERNIRLVRRAIQLGRMPKGAMEKLKAVGYVQTTEEAFLEVDFVGLLKGEVTYGNLRDNENNALDILKSFRHIKTTYGTRAVPSGTYVCPLLGKKIHSPLTALVRNGAPNVLEAVEFIGATGIASHSEERREEALRKSVENTIKEQYDCFVEAFGHHDVSNPGEDGHQSIQTALHKLRINHTLSPEFKKWLLKVKGIQIHPKDIGATRSYIRNAQSFKRGEEGQQITAWLYTNQTNHKYGLVSPAEESILRGLDIFDKVVLGAGPKVEGAVKIGAHNQKELVNSGKIVQPEIPGIRFL